VVDIIGTYECKSDVKGRFMLPSSLKKQLKDVIKEGFVIKRSVFYKCLEMHPMSEWTKVMRQVNTLNRFVKKNNDFIRSYMSGLRIVEVDSAGRCLIPKDLYVYAELKKELVLSSAVNMIEIWDKESYENSIAVTLSNFGDLAEEVMGQQNQEESDGLS